MLTEIQYVSILLEYCEKTESRFLPRHYMTLAVGSSPLRATAGCCGLAGCLASVPRQEGTAGRLRRFLGNTGGRRCRLRLHLPGKEAPGAQLVRQGSAQRSDLLGVEPMGCCRPPALLLPVTGPHSGSAGPIGGVADRDKESPSVFRGGAGSHGDTVGGSLRGSRVFRSGRVSVWAASRGGLAGSGAVRRGWCPPRFRRPAG